jgi:hypothetical protein
LNRSFLDEDGAALEKNERSLFPHHFSSLIRFLSSAKPNADASSYFAELQRKRPRFW